MRLPAHSVNQQPPAGSATIACGLAARSGSGNSRTAVGGDPAELAGGDLDEPEGVVGPERDTDRGGPGGGQLVQDDRAVQADPADGVRLVQGEPQAIVRTRRDHGREAAADGQWELGDDAVGGDPADRSAFISVNHRAPSGPAVMPKGPLSGVGVANDEVCRRW